MCVDKAFYAILWIMICLVDNILSVLCTAGASLFRIHLIVLLMFHSFPFKEHITEKLLKLQTTNVFASLSSDSYVIRI